MTGYPEDGVFLEKKSPWQKRDWIWCWMICFQGRGSCAIRQEFRWSSMSTLRWEKISAHVSEQCWKSCTFFRVWKGIFEMRDLTKRHCGIRENINGMRDLTKRQCEIRENVDGMRDLTKRQGGIRENIDGMRDLTKRQCGVRENVDRCAIWLLAGKRNLPKGTDADWERKWCSGWRWQKFGMCYFRENGAEMRDQESPFPDPSLSDRRVVKTYRHALFVV